MTIQNFKSAARTTVGVALGGVTGAVVGSVSGAIMTGSVINGTIEGAVAGAVSGAVAANSKSTVVGIFGMAGATAVAIVTMGLAMGHVPGRNMIGCSAIIGFAATRHLLPKHGL